VKDEEIKRLRAIFEQAEQKRHPSLFRRLVARFRREKPPISPKRKKEAA
jgi:hypothetical protein